MTELLKNEYFWMAVVGAGGWLWRHIVGKRVDTRAAKVAAALAEAAALCLQLVYTAPPEMTVERMIVQAKGVVAMRLADVGVFEADRAPFQKLIDKVVAEAVAKFVELRNGKRVGAIPIAGAVARYTA